MLITEVKRSQLLAQSRQNIRNKRKIKSSIGTSANAYNKVDMNKLFKEDILECNIPVKGETDDYTVTISYAGVLEELKKEIAYNKNAINLRCCVQALQKAFNKNDVYLNCDCKDFIHRFKYWSTIKRYQAAEPELRPSKKTNPENNKGIGCKHVLLVLSRTLWILKVSSVLWNYQKYMEKNQKRLYDKLIFPKLFEEQPIEDEVNQLSFFDDEQKDDKDIENEEDVK